MLAVPAFGDVAPGVGGGALVSSPHWFEGSLWRRRAVQALAGRVIQTSPTRSRDRRGSLSSKRPPSRAIRWSPRWSLSLRRPKRFEGIVLTSRPLQRTSQYRENDALDRFGRLVRATTSATTESPGWVALTIASSSTTLGSRAIALATSGLRGRLTSDESFAAKGSVRPCGELTSAPAQHRARHRRKRGSRASVVIRTFSPRAPIIATFEADSPGSEG